MPPSDQGSEPVVGTEPPAEAAEPKAVALSNEELKGMIGELIVGAEVHVVRDGWLGVDEAGTPTGSGTLLPPSDGQSPAFPIRANVVAVPSDLVTSSGAPIMDSGMQPSPQLSKYSSPSYNRDYSAPADAA